MRKFENELMTSGLINYLENRMTCGENLVLTAVVMKKAKDGGEIFSETSIDFYRPTRRYIPEDRTLQF
jgi:hypothetical protein